MEREGSRGDEGEEFGAGVGWEMDVWHAGFVEEVRAGRSEDEDGCEVGYLGIRLD